jgi:hypothetical protein
MTVCDDCFHEYVHPLFHELMGKNEEFEKRYGPHESWDWDDELITLTFSDPVRPLLRIDVTVVGSTEGDSWEWAWANKNWEAKATLDMEKVREFGETNGYDKLTSAFLEADEYTGWEMTAVAAHILDAPGGYRFPTDYGYCYLVYRKIEEIETEEEDVLFGAMRGTVTILPGVDLTEPTGEIWDAQK